MFSPKLVKLPSHLEGLMVHPTLPPGVTLRMLNVNLQQQCDREGMPGWVGLAFSFPISTLIV